MQHQSRVAVFVHLTWGTWDRLPLLTREVESSVYRALGAECTKLGTDLIALGGIEDHVHLLTRLPATVSLAELVKQIKGSSTHLVTHLLTQGQSFKWQGGYAAFSVSPRHLPQVTAYIARQKEHHAAGTLLATLERIEHHPVANLT